MSDSNSPTVFTETNRLLGSIGARLSPGQDFNLRGITLPHYPIRDTALAACLATMDVPFREPGPFTNDVALDENENEQGRTTLWWLADYSQAGSEYQGKLHKTEELIGAWMERERFEKEHPMHPLVAMRAAIDARSYWLQVIQAWRDARGILPEEVRKRACFSTDSLHGASVLKACGYVPLAFNGRWFFLERVNKGVAAEHLLIMAAQLEGAAPQQWMSRVLFNYSQMLKTAKEQPLIIRQKLNAEQTLLLTADATPKTREKFHALTD